MYTTKVFLEKDMHSGMNNNKFAHMFNKKYKNWPLCCFIHTLWPFTYVGRTWLSVWNGGVWKGV